MSRKPSSPAEVPSTSATKQDLEDGLLLFKKEITPRNQTRAHLIMRAGDLGCLEDIDERAWLCKQIDIEFMIDMTNYELVQLALDAGADFNKRG